MCTFRQLRNENPFRIIIGHININSVRNEIGSLVDPVSANSGVLMISETKTNETVPGSQLIIERFSNPYCLDHTVNVGLIFSYVRKDISTKCVNGIAVNNSFEAFFIN